MGLGANLETAWHTLSTADTARKLETDLRSGLNEERVPELLEAHGPNELPSGDKKSALALFLSQFEDPMIWVLIAAALVSGILLHEIIDALAIATILFINAVLGFRQEYKAEKAMEALQAMAAPVATVIRSGAERVIPARELVPGDLVTVEAGDKLTADMRVVEASSMLTNEAALTGESAPVGKTAKPLDEEEIPLADRSNMLYMGTAVAAGHGRAIVTATGKQTAFGRIADMINVAEEPTPLQEQLARVGKAIAVLVLAISVVIFALGTLARGLPPAKMFLIAVSLAVAAIPEGLPAAVTVALSLGVQSMARSKAIIRKLHAVETLGSTTVICTDKTGTLTENRMVLAEIITSTGDFAPAGTLDDIARETLQAALLCNDARYGSDGPIGDPTEIAILEAGPEQDINVVALRDSYPRFREAPFDSTVKSMATAHENAESWLLFVKGAPEAVLPRCARFAGREGLSDLDEKTAADLVRSAESVAKKGYRTLAVAEKAGRRRDELGSDLYAEGGLTFLGFLALHDPPRAEAAKAVETCGTAGIRVIMVTGDHPLTAKAIARGVGIPSEEVLTGMDLSRLDDDELAAALTKVSIFARTDPADKQRLVRALQTQGHVVAMTGDGVNDAPALKRSDIGVAMGVIGTDVSKEAADMILADDNFATIVEAVRQGRHVFQNLSKFILYLISCNISEVTVLTLAVFLPWLPLPLLPVQILWINLITDGLPALALGVDPPSPGLMTLRPRPKSQGILTGNISWWTAWQGLAISLGVLGVFLLAPIFLEVREAELRTLVFTTMVFGQLVHAFHFRRPSKTVFSTASLRNRPLLLSVIGSAALQLLAVYTPFLQTVFETMPIGPLGWGLVLTGALAPLLLLDLTLPLRHRLLADGY